MLIRHWEGRSSSPGHFGEGSPLPASSLFRARVQSDLESDGERGGGGYGCSLVCFAAARPLWSSSRLIWQRVNGVGAVKSLRRA